MRFRSSGDPHWHEGRTENISRSGVLFRSAHLMPRRTPIEMLLALPAEVGGGGGESATVICRGRVVRSEPPNHDDTEPAMAATIAGYRLTHSQGSDPRRI
jgi:hypothetical protein